MQMDVREFHTVVVAALLHDIGKFLQRGKSLPFSIEGKHPEVSARFVRAFAETFQTAADVDLLETLVLRHHRGRGFTGLSADEINDERPRLLACLVNKADGLSSSERREHAEQWQDYKTTPLASVFPSVFAGASNSSHANYHPEPLTSPQKLSRQAIFPADFKAYAGDELDTALKGFGEHARPLLAALRGAGFDTLVNHLLALLLAYAWPIPADTQEVLPDTSLYDHLKSTAAIAACLYLWYHERDSFHEASVRTGTGEPFILAVGDVSGIQRYIFDIASPDSKGGGTARRLRARSLYVQLISDVAALPAPCTLRSARHQCATGIRRQVLRPPAVCRRCGCTAVRLPEGY